MGTFIVVKPRLSCHQKRPDTMKFRRMLLSCIKASNKNNTMPGQPKCYHDPRKATTKMTYIIHLCLQILLLPKTDLLASNRFFLGGTYSLEYAVFK